jgi:hypothetical protein
MSCRSNSRALLGKALRSLLLRRVIFSNSAVTFGISRTVYPAFNFLPAITREANHTYDNSCGRGKAQLQTVECSFQCRNKCHWHVTSRGHTSPSSCP